MNLILLAEFLKKSGLRKVGACLYIFTLLAFLLFRGVLPHNDFVTLAMIVIGGLIGGNAYEHHVTGKNGGDNGKPADTSKDIVAK